jgi:two-component system sensor histidine kinase PilS (NtrC family)
MEYTNQFIKRTGLIIVHPLLITFILLSSYPIIHDIPTPFWFIILSSFILAIIFLLIQNWIAEKTVLYMIFFSDIFIIGAMIHCSGGLESIFPLLYVLLIILTSLYLEKKGTYIISLSAVVFFFILVFIEKHGSTFSMQMVLYRFYVFGLLFLLTGIMSGMLSERYQKRTEEAKKLRLTTEEMINYLPSGIMTVDDKGAIIYTNIPEGTSHSRVHLQLVKFLKNPNIQNTIELKIAKRYYFLSCVRIYSSRVALGTLQDYTEIKKLEEKSRISKQTKLLAELGGSLAHEIRNPLASIRGSLEVVLDAEKNKERLHFINMALKESIRLNEIVTDFLNFAQFVPLKKNRLRISEIINESLIDSLGRTNLKKVTIKRKDNDFSILGDLNKLKSCFINLINNAYEASQEGQTIEIDSYTNKKQGIVKICDHGKGMIQKDVKRIFEPFFTTKKGGIGLGLSIVKNVIEAHGGKIEVKSKPGKGTTFKLVFPLV